MNFTFLNYKIKEKNTVFFQISIAFATLLISIINWFSRYIFIQRFTIIQFCILFIAVVLLFFIILNKSSIFRTCLFTFLLSTKLKNYFLFIKKCIPYNSWFTLNCVIIFFYLVEYNYINIHSLSLYLFIVAGSIIRVYFFTGALLYDKVMKSQSLKKFLQNQKNSCFFMKSSTIILSPTPAEYEIALKLGGPQLMEKTRLAMVTAFGASWATGESTIDFVNQQSSRIIDTSPIHKEKVKKLLLNLEEKKATLLKDKENSSDFSIIKHIKEEKINVMIERANKLRNEFSITPSYASKLCETVSTENVVFLGAKEISYIVTKNSQGNRLKMSNIINDYNNAVNALGDLENELDDLDPNSKEIVVSTVVEQFFFTF